MRKSSIFATYLAANIALLGFLGVNARTRVVRGAADIESSRALTRRLGLTDLCLFTEANYTRHVSQADLHTPFMDGPFTLDHFPSGALVRPPVQLKRRNEPRH